MKIKSITTFLSLAFLLLVVSKSYSETNEKLFVSFNTPGVVLMKFAGSQTSASRLYILDKDQQVIYTELLRNKVGMAKLYNIKSLPEGEYFFKLVTKEGTIVKSVVYGNGSKGAKPLNVGLTSSALPGKLNLTCTGVDDKEVTISILNQSNELIFSENIDLKKNFTRTYDLSKIKESNVIFRVSSEDRVVTKVVELRNASLSLN